MRIVFFATPQYVVPVVETLCESLGKAALRAVYTQVDRRAGRGRKLQVPAIKAWASAQDIAVEQPHGWNQDALQRLADYAPDFLITAAYGQLLPATVLSVAKQACVNIHTSLLPRWRGAAPVVRAIEAGDTKTGVSLMQMKTTLDTGDIIAQKECAIASDDTTGTLTKKLMTLAGTLLLDFFQAPDQQLAQARPQAQTGVCYAPRIEKQERQIDWNQEAGCIAQKIRAFNPAPLAETSYQGRHLGLVQAHPASPSQQRVLPGTVTEISKEGLFVQCGHGSVLCVEQVQPAAKRIMSAWSFSQGHPVRAYMLGSTAWRKA